MYNFNYFIILNCFDYTSQFINLNIFFCFCFLLLTLFLILSFYYYVFIIYGFTISFWYYYQFFIYCLYVQIYLYIDIKRENFRRDRRNLRMQIYIIDRCCIYCIRFYIHKVYISRNLIECFIEIVKVYIQKKKWSALINFISCNTSCVKMYSPYCILHPVTVTTNPVYVKYYGREKN